MTDLGFAHVYHPPRHPGSPTLLALHGTGGNEHDLLPIARAIDSAAGVLSPRGQVLERGAPRFFRRLAEGIFDENDLRERTAELARFVRQAADTYMFDRRLVVAIGFSNGANIASSLLLLVPGMLAGAILFRGMVPLVPDTLPSLGGTPVLLSNGRQDPLITDRETHRLVELLRSAGANVTLTWQTGGHVLTSDDVTGARAWLAASGLRGSDATPTEARD